MLTVACVETSAAFSRDMLGMGVETFRAGDGSLRPAVTFGAQKIILQRVASPFRPHAARPEPGAADLCAPNDAPLGGWKAHPAGRRGGGADGAGSIVPLRLRDAEGTLIEVPASA